MKKRCPTGRTESRRSSGSRLGGRAFTLIELMIVVSVIAILAAVGLPAFVQGLRKEGLRKAVSDVIEGCGHARAQSILQGMATELVIRAEDGQITVRPYQPRNPEEAMEVSAFTAGAAPKPAAVSTFKANLPDDIAVTLLDVNFQDQMGSTEAHVRFFPNGTCDEFSISLSSLQAEQLIRLDVITGLAEVTTIK